MDGERWLRLVARTLGALVLVFGVVMLGGELLSGPAPPGGYDARTIVILAGYWIALAGLGLAWWRPLEGGTLTIVGALLPIVDVASGRGFALSTQHYALAALGLLHVADGAWRGRRRRELASLTSRTGASASGTSGSRGGSPRAGSPARRRP